MAGSKEPPKSEDFPKLLNKPPSGGFNSADELWDTLTEYGLSPAAAMQLLSDLARKGRSVERLKALECIRRWHELFSGTKVTVEHTELQRETQEELERQRGELYEKLSGPRKVVGEEKSA